MKVAVALAGLTRTFNETAPSLMRRVVDVHEADVFLFTPSTTDAKNPELRPIKVSENSRTGDIRLGEETEYPADLAHAERLLGSRLKRKIVYEPSPERFDWTNAIDRREILFGIPPINFSSMFFNFAGVLDLVLQHERETGVTYDHIILTRPDLAYFSNLYFEPFPSGQVHIPIGGGVSAATGQILKSNAPAFFYENVTEGLCTPTSTGRVNDQLLVFHRDDLPTFKHIYSELPQLVNARWPLNPESILYTWLTERHGIELIEHREWFYQIHRVGAPLIRNLTDLGDFHRIDPSNPRARFLIEAQTFGSKVHGWQKRLRELACCFTAG